MRPDFSKIDYKAPSEPALPHDGAEWLSPEHIPIKRFYTPG